MALPRRPFPSRLRALAAVLGALALATFVGSPVTPATAAATVSISGVLVDAAGRTAGYKYLQAYEPDGGAGWGTHVATVRTGIGGEFSIDGLDPGRSYRVRANWSSDGLTTVPSFAGFFTDDPADPMTANPASAALFVPGESGIADLRLQLERSTEVSGRVVGESGAPIEGYEITAYPKTSYIDLVTAQYSFLSSGATTRADGTFRLTGLEYIGDEVEGWVLYMHRPGRHGGHLSRNEASVGLVPIDQARLLTPGVDGITGLEITLPEVRLPAEQIRLGRPITSTDRWGQVIAVGSGTLSAFSLESPGGRLDAGVPVRGGFAGERVYLPGDWGGVALDWLENSNPGWSHFEYYDDVVSIDERGDMWLYEGNGRGALREPRKIGQGWNGYRVIPAGDLTGEGHPDLLAIDPNGDLKLYRGNGTGGFLWPYPKVGRGWIGYDLYAAGDLTLDNRVDILSVDSRGDLYMYAGNGNGTFQGRVKVGRGWGTYTLASGADIDGYHREGWGTVNGAADIVGRNDATGDLYLYSGRGDGAFPTKRLISSGW